MYRLSQRLVDVGVLEGDSQLDAHFLDVLLLRHQMACQSIVFPEIHEEKFLTWRLLKFVLTEIKTAASDEMLRSYKLDLTTVSEALANCSKNLLKFNRLLFD